MTKTLVTTNAKGDMILTFGTVKYSFREPVGRDLVSLERSIKTGDNTDAETLAAIMSQQGLDVLTADDYLNLPLSVFKTIGEKMLVFFRAESN